MQRKFLSLLEIMTNQALIISNQSEFIDKLINENMEKENMVNTLLEDINLR